MTYFLTFCYDIEEKTWKQCLSYFLKDYFTLFLQFIDPRHYEKSTTDKLALKLHAICLYIDVNTHTQVVWLIRIPERYLLAAEVTRLDVICVYGLLVGASSALMSTVSPTQMFTGGTLKPLKYQTFSSAHPDGVLAKKWASADSR